MPTIVRPGCSSPGYLHIHERVLTLQIIAADQFATHVPHGFRLNTLDTDRYQAIGKPAQMSFQFKRHSAVHTHDFVDPIRKQESAVVRGDPHIVLWDVCSVEEHCLSHATLSSRVTVYADSA